LRLSWLPPLIIFRGHCHYFRRYLFSLFSIAFDTPLMPAIIFATITLFHICRLFSPYTLSFSSLSAISLILPLSDAIIFHYFIIFFLSLAISFAIFSPCFRRR
jgi:hypothetical protein